MSLTLVRKPYEITLARNQAVFSVETTNLYEETDVFPSISLEWAAKNKDGEGFYFEITDPDTGNIVSFEFSAAPIVDSDGFIYIDDSHVGGSQEYVQSVHNQIKENYKLLAYFDVYYDNSHTIKLEAKQAVADLIPVNFSQRAISGQTIGITINDQFWKKSKRKYYQILLDVFFEKETGSNIFEKVASLRDEPDEKNQAHFDISSILDAEIRDSYDEAPLPDILETDPVVNNITRRYYVSYSETWFAQAITPDWIDEAPMIVHPGGISDEDFAKQDPFSYIQTNKKFLTWQPQGKKLTDKQNDWLSWINYLQVKTVAVKIKAHRKDGTDTGWITISTVGIKRWGEIIIPVGYTQRNISSYATAFEVYKWEIAVFETTLGTQLSETFRFRRNETARKHDVEMLYLNSFGCPETFMTKGEWEEGVDINKQVASRALTYNYNLISGVKFQFDQSTDTNYTARTGYLSKEEAFALRDMMMQTDVFMLEGKQWFPVLIDPNEFTLDKSLTFLLQLEFSMKRSFLVHNHSKANQLPVLIPQFNCGLESFLLDKKFNSIDVYGLMLITKGSTVVYSAIAFTLASSKYILPGTITEEGSYNIGVTLTTVEHGQITYSFTQEVRHKKAFIQSDWHGMLTFTCNLFSGQTEKFYVDWGLGDEPEEYTLTDANSPMTKSLNYYGEKYTVVSTNCPEKLRILDLMTTGLRSFNVNSFYKLEDFYAGFSTMQETTVDVSGLKDLINLVIIESNMDEIEVGFHKNIQQFNVNNNSMQAEAIELFLLKVWKYRKYYTYIGVGIYLQGNPGAGVNMTQTSLDLINGTNAYAGEGLASNYSFNVSY